jgi:polygalacturonase
MTMKLYITVLIFGIGLANCVNISNVEIDSGGSIPFTVNLPSFPEEKYNVIDFGAVGNGNALDTEAIQKAIDFCASKNGGTVYFPPGVYLIGTLFLTSSLHLHLEKGAILRGSDRLEDYPETVPALRSYTDNYTVRSVIYAEGKENIAITGEGIIDGQGGKYPVQYHPYKIRPYIIRMIECKNILIENITLLNSPMWVQHYLACDHLTIKNITVASRRANVNNDGLDIDGCHYVRITGCNISAEDDAIVFKSTMDRSCENIFVDKCTISSYANALKMGTESNGGFRNIIIKDIHIYDTYYSGIALEIVDGGVLDGIDISDIVMENVNNPIFIRLGNRARPYKEGMTINSVGSVRNISIKNVHATNTGYFSEKMQSRGLASKRTGHIPSSISGLPGHPVEDVHLENIFIQYSGGLNEPYDVSREIPEAEDKYPEHHMFGQLPASGFYLRHAQNIHFNNVVIEMAKPDSRQLFYLDKNTESIYKDGELLKETIHRPIFPIKGQ